MTTYRFSYTSEEDGLVKRCLISTLEWATGRSYLQRIYNELYHRKLSPWEVWSAALQRLDIRTSYDPVQLEKIPETGPLIIIANHPFGVVDGAVLCDLVAKKRRDYFLLVNSVLADEPILKGHLLPVDFSGTRAARLANLQTQRESIARLQRGEALVIFPSGGVATAARVFGPPQEFPWRRFIGARIHASRCPVVPVYFHGKNSWLFQLVSKISQPMRLGLLLHEVMNKRGRTVSVRIGDPIPYAAMENRHDQRELIQFLYEHTLQLGTELLPGTAMTPGKGFIKI